MGAQDREKEQVRLVAWQVSTSINLWSTDKVSVAQLMGEEVVGDDMVNDEDALLAEADRVAAESDARRNAAEAGWDGALPEMPED